MCSALAWTAIRPSIYVSFSKSSGPELSHSASPADSDVVPLANNLIYLFKKHIALTAFLEQCSVNVKHT